MKFLIKNCVSNAQKVTKLHFVHYLASFGNPVAHIGKFNFENILYRGNEWINAIHIVEIDKRSKEQRQ